MHCPLITLLLLNPYGANKEWRGYGYEGINHRISFEQQSIIASNYICRIFRTVTDLAYLYQCAIHGCKEREAIIIGDDILTHLCKAKQFISCDFHDIYYRELECGNVYNCYEILKREVRTYDFHLWRGYVDISYKSHDIDSCCVGPFRHTAEFHQPFVPGIYLIGNTSRCIKFYEWCLNSKSRIALHEPLFIPEDMLSFGSLVEMTSRLDYEFFVYIIGYYRRLLERRDRTHCNLEKYKRLYINLLYDTSSISILRLKIVNLLMLSCVLANERFDHVERLLKHLLCGRYCDIEVYFQIVCRWFGENDILHNIVA